MAATDRVALVTGAGRGIGRAIALSLGREGYKLGLVARTAPELEDVAREIESDGGEAFVQSADLSDGEGCAMAVKRVEERFGRLDVVINNAGLAEHGDTADLQIEEIDRVLDVTLRATILVTRTALPYLLHRAEGAAIINIASLAARKPAHGAAIYTAAKHGVLGFSESLFEQLRETGIKISTILPGIVDTQMADGDEEARARMISTDDVAEAVLYVLGSSPRACPTEITIRPQRSQRR